MSSNERADERGPSLGPLFRILAVLLLTHLPWPGLASGFCSYFSAATTPSLHLFAQPGVSVETAPAVSPPAPRWTVVVTATQLRTQSGAKAELDVRRVGWLPLGAFAALLVAFPTARPRRRIAVAALGLAVLHSLWILPVLDAFGAAHGVFFALGGWSHGALVVLERALQSLPGMAYAMPALLWFLLTWGIEPELM